MSGISPTPLWPGRGVRETGWGRGANYSPAGDPTFPWPSHNLLTAASEKPWPSADPNLARHAQVAGVVTALCSVTTAGLRSSFVLGRGPRAPRAPRQLRAAQSTKHPANRHSAPKAGPPAFNALRDRSLLSLCPPAHPAAPPAPRRSPRTPQRRKENPPARRIPQRPRPKGRAP